MGATGARPNFDASPPSTGPVKDSITEKSLEDLLKDLEGATSDDNRYGEKDGPFKTDGTGETDAESDESSDTDGSEDDDAAE